MKAPADWTEPFQAPAFDEYTLVLSGAVIIDHDGGQLRVEAGQSVLTRAGERIRYSTGSEGADYVAVCLPAFSPDTVNREEDGE
jgi:ethanolamine utilization protein EutQ (cupin superfamily)